MDSDLYFVAESQELVQKMLIGVVSGRDQVPDSLDIAPDSLFCDGGVEGRNEGGQGDSVFELGSFYHSGFAIIGLNFQAAVVELVDGVDDGGWSGKDVPSGLAGTWISQYLHQAETTTVVAIKA